MRDRTILAVKGLAIIGVVYHHVDNRRLDPQVLDWISSITFAFHWCVMAFFCVSGYLQALSDSKKHRPFLQFTWARVNRLLVPFVAFVFFYSCLWQLVQATHIPNLATKIPPTFIGKLADALWPIQSYVAEQLYFFPLLFGISIVLVIVQKLSGVYGMWLATVVAAAAGLVYYPSGFTGFSWGVFIWGISLYACGHLLYHYRTQKGAIRIALLVASIVFIALNGLQGLLHCVPLWLLAEGAALRLDRVPLLVKLGDASGTIYVYHTPFLMQPLLILVTCLHGKALQFIGINLAVVVAISLCYLLYESLKNTRAKVILM